MSNDEQFEDPKPITVDELEVLKQRADKMGITYHPSIGLEKLREKVNAKLAEPVDDVKPDAAVKAPEAPKSAVIETSNEDGSVTYAPNETENQKRIRMRKDAARLVRIKLVCMNPNKKEWPGEIITVGNSLVGTHKKFIPFNAGDEGYHVPNIIFKFLKTRECVVYRNGATKNGVVKREHVLIKEFAIEELEPLDDIALRDLAQRQAMANGTSD